jgi:orotate phosphoribosyltransferase
VTQSDELTGYAAQFADMLFVRRAVKFAGVDGEPEEGFKLKAHEKDPSLPLSPIYLNIRAEGHKGGTLRPEDYGLIARVLKEWIEWCYTLDFDYLVGIPEAGEPIADALEDLLRPEMPELYRLHLIKVEHEGKRHIGPPAEEPEVLYPRNYVMLVDDLVTKADTKLEALRACEACGLEARGMVVLVDREQGGREEVDKHCRIEAVMTMGQLMRHYVRGGSITQEMADRVANYVSGSRT